jgi:hypothetical protein
MFMAVRVAKLQHLPKKLAWFHRTVHQLSTIRRENVQRRAFSATGVAGGTVVASKGESNVC